MEAASGSKAIINCFQLSDFNSPACKGAVHALYMYDTSHCTHAQADLLSLTSSVYMQAYNKEFFEFRQFIIGHLLPTVYFQYIRRMNLF